LKIAIVYSHFEERGGAEKVILKQVELLRRKGYEAECYFAYVDKKRVKPLSNPHIYIKSFFSSLFPPSKTLRIVASLPLAPLTAKALSNFDFLLCHGYGPGPWIGCVLKNFKNVKYVSYIHFPPRMFYLAPSERKLWRFEKTRNTLYFLSRFSGFFVKKLDFLGVLNSDKVLVNSFFTALRVKKIYGVDSVVCYPPVDTYVFKPLEEEKFKELKAKFGYPLVVSSGRIVAIKRWEWLIEALTYLKKEFPKVSLAIAGEVSNGCEKYFLKLVRLAKRLGVQKNVKFFGFVPVSELARIYNAGDVYAYPTPQEDFGLGPVEAMACGTLGVVWDDGGGPCETVVDGKTGFRAKPYCIEDFAEKILKALEVDKESKREFLHRYVEERFSCDRHIEQLEDVFESMS